MRFLHLADLHIGKIVNEFPMLDDQQYMLGRIVDFVRKSNRERAGAAKIDAVLIAGDLYDKSTPSAEAVALVDRFLTALADEGTACFAIPGNHDSAERVGYASEILSHSGIYVTGPYKGVVRRYQLEDEHGTVNFWLLPFVRPANVRPYFPEDEIDTNYTAAVRSAIAHSDVDLSQRNVILAHQFVSFGSSKPERSGSEIGTVGGLDEVNSSVFDGFDYVALGHIHKSQAIAASTVRYAGSLLKYSFSEARQEKAFPLVTLKEKGDVEIEELRLSPLHDLREIEGPLEQLVSPEAVEAAAASDYLHVTLADEHPVIDALQRLRAVYPNIMQMDYRSTIDRAKQLRHRAISAADIDFSPADLFRSFYKEQFGNDLTELQEKTFTAALSQCLEGAMHETAVQEKNDATD